MRQCPPGIICFSPSTLVFMIFLIIALFGIFYFLQLNATQSQNPTRLFSVPAASHPQPLAIINQIESSDSLFDLDELNEAVWDSGVLQEEFIYYHDAIKYLMENDPSLSEAFEIASEHCFDTKNLNSCVLAGLLASRLNEEDWHNLARELNEEDFDDDGERRDQMLEQILDV